MSAPMTREELDEGFAELADSGKLGGYCERHFVTMYHYLDRAGAAERDMEKVAESWRKTCAERDAEIAALNARIESWRREEVLRDEREAGKDAEIDALKARLAEAERLLEWGIVIAKRHDGESLWLSDCADWLKGEGK